MFFPSNSTSPTILVVSGSPPTILLMRVDIPLPLSPTIPIISPFFISRLKSETATFPFS